MTLRLAPGLSRVQSLDPEDDDLGGLVLVVNPSGGVLVRWDDGANVWTTATNLCREGERPDAVKSRPTLEAWAGRGE